MPTEELWIIVTYFDSGDKAYWGRDPRGQDHRRTPYKGNAYRYESRDAALNFGYSLKEAGRLESFEVEQLPRKPRLK
jgi:hypothetical protein